MIARTSLGRIAIIALVAGMFLSIGVGFVWNYGCQSGPDPVATHQQAEEQFVTGENQRAAAAPKIVVLKTSAAPEAKAAVAAEANLAADNANLLKANQALAAEIAKANAPPPTSPVPGSTEDRIITFGGMLPAPWNGLVPIALLASGLVKSLMNNKSLRAAAKSVVTSFERAKMGSATFNAAMNDPVVVGILDDHQTPDAKALVDSGQKDVLSKVGVLPTPAAPPMNGSPPVARAA